MSERTERYDRNAPNYLAPDREQLETFIQTLFKHTKPDNWISLRTFEENQEVPPFLIRPLRVSGATLIERAYADAEMAANNPKRLVFAPPIATFTNPDHAGETSLAEGPVLSTELDKRVTTARARLEKLLGRATLVMQSGGEWIDPQTGEVQPKEHVHYRLAVPARSPAELLMLKEARWLATKLVGGDDSNIPAIHPLRWAGSWHRKNEPRLARIIVHNPNAEIDLGQALKILREAAAVEGFAGNLKSGSGSKSNGSAASSGDAYARLAQLDQMAPSIEAVIEALKRIPNKEREWNEWNYVGLVVWAATGGSDAGGAAFAAWSAKAEKNDPAMTLDRWKHYQTSPPTKLGFGTLVYMARQFESGWNYQAGKANGTAGDDKGAGTNDRAGTFSAKELGKMHFDPIKYVVPGVIVEGLTLFAGKPKIGKSWLLLHAAHAVASGGSTLGGLQCEAGDVLYCALEDNPRRLHSRMSKLFGPPEGWPPRLDFRCELPRLNEGGLEQIKEWILAAKKPRLIIVDTFAMVRAPKKRDESSYDADYNAVIELRMLANAHNVALIFSHHVRKAFADDPFDTVSGTFGLTGAPDTILVLTYADGEMVLHGRGRDLPELKQVMTFDGDACVWTLGGDVDAVRRSDERTAILFALEGSDEPLSPKQIAEMTDMKPGNVRRLLAKLFADGEVEKAGYGKYRQRRPPTPAEEGLVASA